MSMEDVKTIKTREAEGLNVNGTTKYETNLAKGRKC